MATPSDSFIPLPAGHLIPLAGPPPVLIALAGDGTARTEEARRLADHLLTLGFKVHAASAVPTDLGPGTHLHVPDVAPWLRSLVRGAVIGRLPLLAASLTRALRARHCRLVLAEGCEGVLAARLARLLVPGLQIVAVTGPGHSGSLQAFLAQSCHHVLAVDEKSLASLAAHGVPAARASLLPETAHDAEAHLARLLQRHLPAGARGRIRAA